MDSCGARPESGPMAPSEEKPAWWRANLRDRAALELPAYEPARFADGTYVHEVVGSLEAELGCELRLLGRNVTWGDAWAVRVDGEPAFTVTRTRDDAGNTHYQLDAATFERRVRAAVRGDDGPPD